MLEENFIFPNDIKEDFDFNDLLIMCGVKSPKYVDEMDD